MGTAANMMKKSDKPEKMIVTMKFTLKGIQGELVQDVEIHFSFDIGDERVPPVVRGEVDVTGDAPNFPSEDVSVISISAENLTADADGNYVFYAYLPPWRPTLN